MKTYFSKNRASALDALRGIAIIGMILSGSIPQRGLLPAWMYHAQLPPPDHIFNPNLPGITWVDLVFPMFLFAMGAAIPLALSKRVARGDSNLFLVPYAFKRGLLIAFFAIYIQHIKPWSINPVPTTNVWLFSIIGFALLFPMLMRMPDSFSRKLIIFIRIIGYLLAAVLMYLFGLLNNGGFSLYRSDIIILVLANVAFFGSLIWIFTQGNLLLRVGILGFLTALRLTQGIDNSWNELLWNFSPFPWLYKLYYLQYLFLVIPGTIIGDVVLKWMNENTKEIKINEIKLRKNNIFNATILLFIIISNIIGLYSREIGITIIINILLIALLFYQFKNPENKTDKLLKFMCNWGTYFLVLGLFFEAYEGGIKKDHSTLSYYLISTALSMYLYMVLTILIDYLQYYKIFKHVISNGNNPMIAYIIGHTLITPILSLTYLSELLNYLNINPWPGFLKGVIFTSIVVFSTFFFTKQKMFLRT